MLVLRRGAAAGGATFDIVCPQPRAEKKDQGSNNVKNGTSGERALARLRRAGGLLPGGRTPSNSFFPAPTPIRANLVFMAQSMCVCFGELSSELALQLSSPFGDSEATRHL